MRILEKHSMKFFKLWQCAGEIYQGDDAGREVKTAGTKGQTATAFIAVAH